MPGSQPKFQYAVYRDEGCVCTRYDGDFHVETFVAGLQAIFADGAVTQELNYLHDWRRARFSKSMDYRSLASHVRLQGDRMQGDRAGARVAIVMPDDEAFGIARQTIVLLEQAGGAEIQRKPFLDLEEACAWLGVSSDSLLLIHD
jgi:hypothetical protein